ncbi:uncharacterized protein K452DRAFT_359650 [Aplosporella prunicola CBS 121167]|uniref:Uncharacterized protein n=1 Tax=Aplosporella prunicola CBS 121167 TaxID=1176127 RepID=A0A6A6B8V3_9PEZI|nr:uncharacterized protein K452DRAFT_359650 [Aplosporella prunicola CBS 121167]KAF2140609.1 hypothetical protein K452DRAFT_359650 [Aplosporella prunicola CBS 121167]
MAAPSPSEFLTFYRRLATHPTLRRGFASPATTTTTTTTRRAFSAAPARLGFGKPSTDSSVKTDQYPDDKHTTNKSDELDVQNQSSSAGKASHASGTGGGATSRRDERGSTAKAKKEHPEAPDVVIGMQDERGGKGN